MLLIVSDVIELLMSTAQCVVGVANVGSGDEHECCNGKIRIVGPWENIHLFLLVILLLETRRRREHGRATPTLAGKP